MHESFSPRLDNNGPLDEYWRKTMLFLTTTLSYELSQKMGQAIEYNQLENQEGLDRALYALGKMQICGYYHGEQIGLIDPQAPGNVRGKYRQGQIVLFSDPDEVKGKVVVEEPYPRKQIEVFLAKKQHLFTHSTTVNVPALLIRPVISKKER